MFVNLLHPANAFSPIVEIVVGSVIVVTVFTFWNALSLTFVPCKIVTSVKLVERFAPNTDWKLFDESTSVPINGSVTLVRFVQPTNALS